MSAVNIDELPPNMVQTIYLQGDGAAHTIHGFEVGIRASHASTEGKEGSSKVKISTITNQNWSLPDHHGNIVASNNHYTAYILEGRNGYVLRLIQQETNARALLKGFIGAVVDIAFAHSRSNLLAAVDQGGNVYVWDLGSDISHMEQAQALRLEVTCSEDPDQQLHRVVWCPYVPAEGEEDDGDSPTLVATHGSSVDVFNLAVVIPAVEGNPRVPQGNLPAAGVATIAQAHDKPVFDASLSPDGGVLATGGQDGHLKFWRILFDSTDPPSCLHDFEPHKGAEVTRLIFCDNHLSQDASTPFWRFLITASKNNSEVKVWCAVSWKCLQTVRFLPPEGSNEVDPHIILNLDLSASYLLATDAKRKALYVLQVFQDDGLSDASVTSVTEYLLTQPILSFVVAGHTPFLPADGAESGDEADALVPASDFDSRRNIVNIKLDCVHTRSMQKLLVRFEPPDLLGIPQQPLPGDDLLKEMVSSPVWGLPATSEASENPPPPPSTLALEHTHSASAASSSPKLLTPSEFSSPAKSDVSLLPLLQSTISHSVSSTLTSVTTDVLALTPGTSIGDATAGSEDSKELSSLPQFPPHPIHSMALGSTSSPLRDESDNSVPEELKSTLDTLPGSEEGVNKKVEEDAKPGDEDATVETEGLESELKGLKSDESEEEVSTSETQQSLNNIFDMLRLDTPVTKQPGSSYEEFTKRLLDPPTKTDAPLTSTAEEGVGSPHPPEATPTEDDTKTTPSEYLKLLRRNVYTSSSDEQLVVSDTSAVESDSDLLQPKGQWPDIGESSSSQEPPPDHFPTADVGDGGGLTAFSSPPPPLPPVATATAAADVEEAPTLQPSTLSSIAASSLQASVEVAPKVKPSTFSDETLPVLATLELAPEVKPSAFSDQNASPTTSEAKQPDTPGSLQSGGGSTAEEGGSHDRSPKSHVSVEFQPETLTPPEPTPTAPAAVAAAGGEDDGDPHSCSLPQQEDSASASQSETVRSSATHQPEMSEPLGSHQPETASPAVNGSQLAALYELVARQQEELARLRQEQQACFSILQQSLERVEASVVEQQRAALSEHAREQLQKMERLNRDSKTAEKQRQEKLASSLSTAVSARLDKVVKSEVKSSVIPAVSRSLAGLHEQLATAVTQKVGSSVDTALRGGVEHMLQAKGLPESISSAVAASLQRMVQGAYEEALRSTLLPGFDHSCKEMFGQIDSAFRRGTTEYLAQVHQQSQGQHQQAMNLQQQLLPSLSSLQHLLTTPSSPLYTNIEACIQREMATLLQQTQQTVKEVVNSAVQREVDAAMEKHAQRLSPEARLLEERKQMQEALSKMIVAQQFNAAFEKALSTSDLDLVLFVCQQVTPEEVFDKAPSPLSQPVVLSLIQQLSVDFKEHVEIKLKYLENSVMALDASSGITRSHMVPVLSSLRQQLATLEKEVQGNPALSRQLKRLSMLAQATIG